MLYFQKIPKQYEIYINLPRIVQIDSRLTSNTLHDTKKESNGKPLFGF